MGARLIELMLRSGERIRSRVVSSGIPWLPRQLESEVATLPRGKVNATIFTNSSCRYWLTLQRWKAVSTSRESGG